MQCPIGLTTRPRFSAPPVLLTPLPLCVSPVINSFRSILLEKKLEAEAEQLEHKEAQLTEVLARANLDPTLLGRVRARP